MAQISQKMQGDGFVIENGIIKGDEKCYGLKEDNIGELVFNALSERPECIAEIDALTETSKTFAEIKERSVHLAAWMRKEGIGPGNVVSVCTPRHPDVIIIYYATLYVGATYFPFTRQVDLISSRRQMNILPPQLIFTSKNNIDVLQEAATLENNKWKMIVIDNDCSDASLTDIFETPLPDEIKNFKVSKVNPKNMCLVISTSGTTGTPKMIPIDYEAMMYTILMLDITEKTNNSNEIVLAYPSVEWKSHYTFPIKCLMHGWTQIYHNDFDCHETYRIIEKYKINILIVVVTNIYRLNHADQLYKSKYDLKSLTSILTMGAKLYDEVRKRTLEIFPNVDYIGRGFGMAETCFVTLFNKKCLNPESEGTVLPNTQLKIIDRKTGLALGCNEVGELCIKGPCMMKGYYKNPKANELAFDDQGWFHSGDEAYYDENGEIVVIGRLNEIIRYRDTAIYPLHIEQSLFLHPNIIDAAVVGIKHDLYNEQPVAYVKVSERSNVTEEDVLKLMPKLEYKDTFRGWVLFIDDEIPRSENGKIIRRILKERAENFYKSQSR